MTSPHLTAVTLGALEQICNSLRAVDADEILNLRAHDSWAILALEAHYVLTVKGRGVIAWVHGMPAAVIGFGELRPGVWDAVSFGTDDYEAAGVALMRAGRMMARDILNDPALGARRLQADAKASNTRAHAFIRALGGVPEGPPMRSYGKDGSAYQRFIWLREDGAAQLVGAD